MRRLIPSLLVLLSLAGPALAQEIDRAALTRQLTPVTGEPGQVTTASVDLSIAFEFGTATLTAAARRQLDELAAALATPALSPHKVRLAGHTDATGDPVRNRTLSLERARSVAAYLTGPKGLAADRFATEGHGADRLKTPRDPRAAVNRRVEVTVIATAPGAVEAITQ
jgi:outer membrane protein OmpA-like peptidoglycan-associated protein